MKKILLSATILFAAFAVNAQKIVKTADEVCNFVDIQAEAATLTATIPSSTVSVTSSNGSKFWGYAKSDGTEAAVSWNTKDSYNTTVPMPELEGTLDSLTVGTMFRAGSGCRIELGAFSLSETGVVSVYFQPNGDSNRGVKIEYGAGALSVEKQASGVKLGSMRPGYVAELALPAGSYAAGDVVVTVITNTSNIFGIGIDSGSGEVPSVSTVLFSGLTNADFTGITANGSIDGTTVNYNGSEDDMSLKIKGITFKYKNTTAKSSIFKTGEAYLQADGKNTVIVLEGLKIGDEITINVAAKGDTPAIFEVLSGADANASNPAEVARVDGKTTYMDLKFTANASTVEIKEINAGYRISSLKIAESTSVDTIQEDLGVVISVEVYSLTGVKIAEGASFNEVELPNGIYIVKSLYEGGKTSVAKIAK